MVQHIIPVYSAVAPCTNIIYVALEHDVNFVNMLVVQLGVVI